MKFKVALSKQSIPKGDEMTRTIPPGAQLLRTSDLLLRLRFKKTKLHDLQNPESKYHDASFPVARYLGNSRIPLWVEAEIDEWLAASLRRKLPAPLKAPSHAAKPQSGLQCVDQGQASTEGDASSGGDKRDSKLSASEVNAQPLGMSIYLAQRNAANALNKATPDNTKRR